MPTPTAKMLSEQGTVRGGDPMGARLVEYFRLYSETADDHRQEAQESAMDAAEHAASLRPEPAPSKESNAK